MSAQKHFLTKGSVTALQVLLTRASEYDLPLFFKPTVNGGHLVTANKLSTMSDVELASVLESLQITATSYGASWHEYAPSKGQAESVCKALKDRLAAAGHSLDVTVLDLAGDSLAGESQMTGNEGFAVGQPCYAPDATPIQVIVLKDGNALYGARLSRDMYAAIKAPHSTGLINTLAQIVRSLGKT